MTIQQIPILCDFEETTDSGEGTVNFNSPTFTKIYATYGHGSESDAVARAELYFAEHPTINVNGIVLFIYDYKVKPDSTDGQMWIVTATYKFQVDYFELSFDTSGGTRKVYTALDEGDYYHCAGIGDPDDHTPAGQGFESFNGLIGVCGEQVEGCDTPLPDKFDFTVLIRSKYSTMPAAWLDSVRRITGHANRLPLSIDWKGQLIPFDIEELIFLGMPGKSDSDDNLEVTFKFSAERGRKGGTIVEVDFVQAGAVNVAVSSTRGLAVGDKVFIEGGGYYEIVDIPLITIGGFPVLSLVNLSIDPSRYAVDGQTITTGSYVNFDANTDNPELQSEPLIIGHTGPIRKPGTRYLHTHSRPRLVGGTIVDGRIVGGRNIPQPVVAIVNKVVPTADLSILGIFS